MDYFWMKPDLSMSNTMTYESFSKRERQGQEPVVRMIKQSNAMQATQLSDYITTKDVFEQYHLVSDRFRKLINLYNGAKDLTPVVFVEKQHKGELYWFLDVPKVACLSPKTTFRHDRTVENLVIDKNLLQTQSIFLIECPVQNIPIIRLDMAESILRRGFYGIHLKKAEGGDDADVE